MSPEISGPAELHDATAPAGDGWPNDKANGPGAGWADDQAGGPDPGWADDQTSGPDPGWHDDQTGRPGPGWHDDQTGRPGPGWHDDQTSGPDPGWPDHDAEDERDPDWPDDWPDGGDDPPWRRAAPPATNGRDGGPGRSGMRPLALAIVAVVALGAGAGVALAITKGLDHSPSPSAVPSTQPSAVAPGGSGGGPISGGGTAPGGGAVGEMFVAGPVTAVSSKSITIGGPGHTVTAAITSSTRITGKVTSMGGIKVGDQVSAQITESNGGQPTVAAIQDPAQVPSGGSVP
jgi:hypothetical protein